MCASTRKAWMRELAEGSIHKLAGAYGNRTGCGIIDSQNELRDYVLGRLAEHPDIRT